MASMIHLVCDATLIVTHIINKDRECEQDRNRYHYASLIIQKNYRGYLARKEIKRWHAAATVIQKYVRRFLVRINMAQYMLAHLERLAMRHYNKMATRIQALWKGYIFRKNVLDFRKLYAHKLMVQRVNAEMRDLMRQQKKRAAQEARELLENEAKDMVLFILFKLHHCLRTDKEGLYSIHGKLEYSWIEKLLKSIKFTDYMKALKKLYYKSYKPPEEKLCTLKGRWRECEKAYYKRDRRNDLKSSPPQDPNDFLLEKPFCFDARVKKKYEPYLLTQGEFRYRITKILRDINPELNIITDVDFDITHKMVEFISKVPPYYLDYWNQICELHNFVGD